MDASEFDDASSRGYGWRKRANQINERDDDVCQRCGDCNENYDHFPLAMSTHHIVPGKYLPKSDARVDLNLVTLCRTCHGSLEGVHVERQLAAIGRDDTLQVLEFLKGRRRNIRRVSKELDIPKERVESLIHQLECMNLVYSPGGQTYRAYCPAVSASLVQQYEAKWQREHQTRQQLEQTRDTLRYEFSRILDDLEYGLETGHWTRVTSALQRGRDVLEEVE
ncbi:HNH endonuclease [Natrononativus amylolyticus]|uniref:HNH endonuclease n=1 Tax=Natrononativus amylolyticus TaxID=2963434 RepID=UPI003CE44B93